jgi:hypothetical protein
MDAACRASFHNAAQSLAERPDSTPLFFLASVASPTNRRKLSFHFAALLNAGGVGQNRNHQTFLMQDVSCSRAGAHFGVPGMACLAMTKFFST